MSISQNFPNTRPSLNLNFARSKTLDPRITFSRTSTGTYVDESGVIRDAVADEPRFDHDPVTGECLGLLIEESRVNNYHIWNSITDTATNLNSSYIDTQTVSSVLTPRGVAATAYTATKTGNTGQYHGLNSSANSFNISEDTSVSASAYIKDFNNSDYRLYFVISAYNASTDNRRYILYRARPSTGEWITGTVHSNWSTPVINVKDVGNGWYRFEISATNTYEAGWDRIDFNFQLLNELNQQFYDPPTANTHGLYLSSPQFELGNFPTSYIPTNGSNGSRTPDNVSMEGDNFSDWYNQSEGTIFYDQTVISYPSTAVSSFYTFSDGTGNNRISGFIPTGSNHRLRIDESGSNTYLANAVFAADVLSPARVALAFKTNDTIGAYNGLIGFLDDDVTIPSVNRLNFGEFNGNLNMSTRIKKFTFWPQRLPDQILQTLTK